MVFAPVQNRVECTMSIDKSGTEPALKQPPALYNGILLKCPERVLIKKQKILKVLVSICQTLGHTAFYRIVMTFFKQIDEVKPVICTKFVVKSIEKALPLFFSDIVLNRIFVGCGNFRK